MDLASHKVFRGGDPLHLGPNEYLLLQAFLERPTRLFSREQLLDRDWGREIYVEERTVNATSAVSGRYSMKMDDLA